MYEHDDDEHDLDHEAPRSLGAADGAVRAAPRRARRDQSDAPVFLVKTYQMVDTCVPHIASWSEHGDTFIVKARSIEACAVVPASAGHSDLLSDTADGPLMALRAQDPERFASEVIPQFFKHSNFRSFVRQLNFYGFRKLRNDTAVTSMRPSAWWEFRHEAFRKGHPENLSQIRRAEHYETGAVGAAQQQRQIELESEVTSLKGQLFEVNIAVERLTVRCACWNTPRRRVATKLDHEAVSPGRSTPLHALCSRLPPPGLDSIDGPCGWTT